MFTKEFQIRSHAGAIYALAAWPEKNLIFTGGSDKIVATWNVETHEQHPISIRMEDGIYAMAFCSSLNQLVVGTSKGGIHIIDLLQKKELRHLKIHEGGVFGLRYSEDGKHLFALGGDGVLSIWNTIDFSLLKLLKLSTEKLRTCWVNTTENQLWMGCGEGKIHLVDLKSFTKTLGFEAHAGSVYGMDYHASKNTLITGGKDGHLKIWKSNSYSKPLLKIAAHNFAVYGITETPYGFVSCSRDHSIKIWDKNSFEILQKLDIKSAGGHTKSVNNMLWNESLNRLVTVSDDHSIIFWKPVA